MPRELSISNAVREIVASPAPVLLVDTCALVDVIRAPTREKNTCISAAIELAKQSDSKPTNLYIILAPLIPKEWNTHSINERDNLKAAIEKHEATAMHLRRACDLGGVPMLAPIADYQELPDRLLSIASHLFDVAILLELDDECRKRATNRSIHNLPPSRQGKGLKDCDIVEHYLELCRQLNSASFRRRVVFVTSNTNDFCKDKVTLHEELAKGFSCVNFQFTIELMWALNEIRR